ncbi:AMP-dependent synthetase/ligase [Macleaya cordata]|uniref:AMP-dependent synthetase/ligase n=1 Tax=Macleaya cordata TaxID=56857 RepID=A0A200PVR1_MACCD|nr:AMP-dependent synthetase/ligase [Macleaya cordata]
MEAVLSVDESGFCSSSGIYYSKWGSLHLPETPSLSLPSFLLSQLSPQHLQKPAFIDSTTGKSITYGDLQSLSITIANTLHSSCGVKKGDVVLVVSSNSIHFPLLVLSIMSIGAIFTTANPLYTTQELQTQIQNSNPVLVFTTHEFQSKFDGILTSPPILVEEFMKNLLHNPNPPSKLVEFSINQGDTAALMYSSGTTGKSKAVVCSHRNLVAMSRSLEHVWNTEGDGCNDVYMCVVPLFHMFGLSMMICGVLAVRSTAVIVRKYSMDEMLIGIERYNVTRLPAVPPMVVQMVRQQDRMKHYKLGSLKEVISSGAPLGKDHIEGFCELYPQVRLSQCYGLTETNGPITLCDGINTGKFHVSVGRLIPTMEAKIVDVKTSKPLPPLGCGELCLRGSPVMQGYFQNHEATSFAIDKDGWLHTGDLCYIDEFGLIHIVERIKELIKYKAYQVAPAELEEILSTHPEINDAAITSYPDEEAGEIPMAYVVRKARSQLKEEDIMVFVANKVAPYKKVRKVVFVDSIPRTPSGKILRRQLKAPKKTSSNL